MFHQAPASDSMFVVVIVIIAATVFIFMAVVTFILMRSETKKATPTLPSDEPKLIPPVDMTVASPPNEKPDNVLPSIPLAEDVAALPSKRRIRLQFDPRGTGVIRSLFIRLLWAICFVGAMIIILPIGVYIAALAMGFIATVATFLRAGPIRGKNVLLIAIGFLGWFGINTLLWSGAIEGAGDPRGFFGGLTILIIDVPALLVLSLGGRWTLLGVFLWTLVNAIGTLLFIALGSIADAHFGIFSSPFFLNPF